MYRASRAGTRLALRYGNVGRHSSSTWRHDLYSPSFGGRQEQAQFGAMWSLTRRYFTRSTLGVSLHKTASLASTRLISSTLPRNYKKVANPAVSKETKEINKRLVERGRQHDWKGILETWQAERHQFDQQNYATAMNQLGKIHSLNVRDPRLDELLDDIALNLQGEAAFAWETRSLATILHGIAKRELKSKSATALVDLIPKIRIVEEGNPQDISNIAWSCATLRVNDPALFQMIDERSDYLVLNGTPQAIANTAWACATLGVECPALLVAMEDSTEYLVLQGNPQDIANTAWACATLGVACPALFTAIDDRAEYLVLQGNPQDIANTAWACATLGVKCPALFAAINNRAEFLVSNGTPQAIANTAWACATLGVKCPALFAAINNRAEFLVLNGTPQAIANTAWAFATLGVEWPALFAAINDRAEYLVSNGIPQNIANTAWACAILGVECSALFEAIDDRFAEFASNLDPPSVANLCFSLAVLEYLKDDGRLFKALLEVAILRNVELSGVGHMQLLQSYLMVSTALEILPPSVKWMSSIGNFTFASNESKMQKEMSDCLLDLGFAHEVEVSPFNDDKLNAQGFLAIDAACKDRMIAVEFDGPSHFLREAGTGKVLAKENGPTKAKRRLLQRLGWTVLNVPYFEWEKATTCSEKKQLLRDKLKVVGFPVREL